MAYSAIGRELRIGVIGGGCLAVIHVVTAVASIGGVVVIAVVTGRAIARDRCVGPVQRIVVVVDRESGGFPAWRGGVAHGAIRGDVERHVVRVGALVVIRVVTAVAGVRGVGEIAVVTRVAIAGNGNMRARERINGVVIESGRRPACLCVAQRAIRRELRSGVIGIGRLVVIRVVTAVAGVGRIVVIAVVTSGAFIGDGRVGPVQRIVIVVYRERGRFPAWRGGVAHRTIGRDVERYVVRVGALVEICVVTAVAGVGRAGVIAVVTGVAVIGDGNMRPSERINGVVIERGRRPGDRRSVVWGKSVDLGGRRIMNKKKK